MFFLVLAMVVFAIIFALKGAYVNSLPGPERTASYCATDRYYEMHKDICQGFKSYGYAVDSEIERRQLQEEKNKCLERQYFYEHYIRCESIGVGIREWSE